MHGGRYRRRRRPAIGLPARPRAGQFVTLVTKAGPGLIQSAAILIESVAARYGRWTEIAGRGPDAGHAGDETAEPDGRPGTGAGEPGGPGVHLLLSRAPRRCGQRRAVA